MEIRTYHLLLGSNLGDRLHQLSEAKKLLVAESGVLEQQSEIYETQPWGFEDQPWFLNQAIALTTHLGPLELLHQVKALETVLGRQPGEKWHARHIDMDILLCGDLVFHHPELILPHPHMQDRNFVLIPLMDIASQLVHPVLGKTIEELYAACRDIGEVYIFNPDEHGDPL